jgi:hypothetical protein
MSIINYGKITICISVDTKKLTPEQWAQFEKAYSDLDETCPLELGIDQLQTSATTLVENAFAYLGEGSKAIEFYTEM